MSRIAAHRIAAHRSGAAHAALLSAQCACCLYTAPPGTEFVGPHDVGRSLSGHLGPDDPELASILDNYAAVLLKTDHTDEAAQATARAKAIRAKATAASSDPEN